MNNQENKITQAQENVDRQEAKKPVESVENNSVKPDSVQGRFDQMQKKSSAPKHEDSLQIAMDFAEQIINRNQQIRERANDNDKIFHKSFSKGRLYQIYENNKDMVGFCKMLDQAEHKYWHILNQYKANRPAQQQSGADHYIEHPATNKDWGKVTNTLRKMSIAANTRPQIKKHHNFAHALKNVWTKFKDRYQL